MVKAATLTSPKQDIDKNMLKALKTDQHPLITFRLVRFEAKTPLKAIGLLTIAGVEREVAFDLKSSVTGSTLTITGDMPLVMTDYGIVPPKAMLGMLKTDPKITVSFEVVLSVSTTN